ncbi:MAG TPA: TlpA disulfide reductase family protein [Gemmataceae bacterium]
MRRTTYIPLAAACAALMALAAGGPAAAQEKKGDVTLKVGKVKDLLAEIGRHKGKVVVVDFWADFCIPCKQEFPNLVRLHNTRAGDGLVAISATVDDPEDKELALKFLKQQKATFFNILVENPTDAQNHWDFTAVPAVAVYGRDGKLARVFTNDDPKNQFTYKDVEAFIEPMLKQGKK